MNLITERFTSIELVVYYCHYYYRVYKCESRDDGKSTYNKCTMTSRRKYRVSFNEVED